MIFAAIFVAYAWRALGQGGHGSESRAVLPTEFPHELHDIRVEVDDQEPKRPLALSGTPATLSDQDERSRLADVVPLARRSRREHLAQLGACPVQIVTPEERKLNRRIISAGVSTVSAIAGIAYPPILVISLGTALYSTVPIFREAYDAIVHEHKLRMSALGSAFIVGEYAGGFFIVG